MLEEGLGYTTLCLMGVGAVEMAQLEKALVTKPDEPGAIPMTHRELLKVVLCLLHICQPLHAALGRG